MDALTAPTLLCYVMTILDHYGSNRWGFSPGRYDRCIVVLQPVGANLSEIDPNDMAYDISRRSRQTDAQGRSTAEVLREGGDADDWQYFPDE